MKMKKQKNEEEKVEQKGLVKSEIRQSIGNSFLYN